MNRRRHSLRLLPPAEDDLAAIVAHVAGFRRSAGEALVERIEKRLRLLSQNPRLGRVPQKKELVPLGYHYLRVDNYFLYYTIENQTIYVHRVLLGAESFCILCEDFVIH